jgi:protein-tyrosine kinase
MASLPSYKAFIRTLSNNPVLAGAYETLLTGLGAEAVSKPNTILLVASTQPGEGKTTVAVNLAIIAARAKQRVLLVDGDVRKPTIHQIMHLDNHNGLGELLSGEGDPQEAVRQVDVRGTLSEARTLNVLPAGHIVTEATLVLGTAKVQQILTRLSNGFELIILDSPPALAFNDAAFLAGAADGIIFVIRAGEVGEKDARQAKEQLERTQTPIIGAVLNRFNAHLHGLGIHPYSRYYYTQT